MRTKSILLKLHPKILILSPYVIFTKRNSPYFIPTFMESATNMLTIITSIKNHYLGNFDQLYDSSLPRVYGS